MIKKILISTGIAVIIGFSLLFIYYFFNLKNN